MKPIAENQILISLASRHASKIYNGDKTVEFRRRKLNVSIGTKIWIYEKLPFGAITGCVLVKSVISKTPEEIWGLYSSVSGLTRSEFFEYLTDSTLACAIELSDVIQLVNPVKLDQLRQLRNNFQPPQFFTRFSEDDPILVALKNCNTQINQIATMQTECESYFLVA